MKVFDEEKAKREEQVTDDDYTSFRAEVAKKAIYRNGFHRFPGYTWCICPWCGQVFEFYYAIFERGFKKVSDNVFRHDNCGKLVKLV